MFGVSIAPMPGPVVILAAAGPLLLGVVCIVTGRMGRDGRLPLNAVVGIRTMATMRSPEAWMAAHEAAAGPSIAAGFVALGTAALIVVLKVLELLVAVRQSVIAGLVVLVAVVGMSVALALECWGWIRGGRAAKRT